jgi:hypothetical protein
MTLVPVQCHHYWFSRVHILLITEVLWLATNYLNGTIPTELGLLSSLEVLDLSQNRLTRTIPTSLASLTLLSKSQSLMFQYSFATNGSHVCTFSPLQMRCGSMTMI